MVLPPPAGMLIPDIAAAVGIDLAQDRDLFDHITFRMRKDGEIERVAPRRYRLSADYNHTERARRPALDSLEVRAANGDSQIAHKLGLGVDEQPAGYGHAATLGQRKSVAHMPTAATTNANSNRSLISKQGAADLSTLTQLARGPAHGGHFNTCGNASINPHRTAVARARYGFHIAARGWRGRSGSHLSTTMKLSRLCRSGQRMKAVIASLQ
jgi:hypothetical protein